ncbi:nucleotidyltransferase [Anaerosalibacter massiliensis]|uniref:tRNA(Met) cytidine acetate ligase n=1 Tax=Anaerosalibacter massiliensis TaxID=1347392 RepID=A0A9X2MEN3_9FIRM|nr:nucleotidyltransferase [Anaerosalibacter massiliensis]MCR2042590.1 nucleotidyltransferase [Anaerosalibacter massiliensis]
MKVLGIISEYNPFHYGHLYHLEESKKITNAEYSIAVISGSFVQRGEPSFVDKWTKTKMAIDNGIDLVLELPVIFSVQSAEFFAYGGVKLLDSLKIVDYISFGSELGQLEQLKIIANIFAKEPYYFKSMLKKYLDKGNSYSVSRSLALEDFLKETKYKENNYIDILKSPNNILAIEYLKSLYKLNSSIKPITIKRIGSNYNEKFFNDKYSSATSIRNKAFKGELDKIRDYLPKPTYYHLNNYLKEYKSFNSIENYSQILMYLLRTIDERKFSKIMDIEDGLENRFIKNSFKYNNIIQVINNTVTKRYPKTRIQRILIQLLIGINGDIFIQAKNTYPQYIRVLGMNNKGMKLLNKIAKKTNIPIINKFADYKKLNNPKINNIINYDKIGTDLYFLGLNNEINRLANLDYYKSPYIKNSKTKN